MPTFRDTKARLSDEMEQQNFVKEPWMSNLGYICVKDMHCMKKYECINYYLWLTDIHGKVSQPTNLTTTSSKSIQTVTCVIADAIYTWSIVFAFVTYTVVDV